MFTNILVDIDAAATAHPALDQAADLARRCGARLKIVEVMNVPAGAGRYVKDEVIADIGDRRRKHLEELAAAQSGIEVSCDVLAGRPAIALIQEVIRSGHDLLMRSHARDLAGYGAVDMHLFRKCPCPVMAVIPGARTRPRRLLAAVHANSQDEEEQKLNARILDLALYLTEVEQGSLTILQAWHAFGAEFLEGRSSEEEYDAYNEGARRVADEDLRQLTEPFRDRMDRTTIELRKGPAENVIPEFVVSEGIDLVVMGTVARTGIPGLIMGNTAERVLRKLVCSVLAVKPVGFQSPVTLESSDD